MATSTATRAAFLPSSVISDRPIRLRTETGLGALQLHADAKTGPSVYWGQDRRPVSIIPNAFGLPSGPVDVGGTCPQYSPNACRSCYAAKLEGGPFAAFSQMVARNLATLERLHAHDAGAVVPALLDLVDRSYGLQIAAGVASPSFRWLSSGDLFSPWFAAAVRDVQRARPTVTFWGYTRSVRYLSNLFGRASLPSNARWFVSVDADNVRTHGQAAHKYGLPVAYLAADRDELANLRDTVAAIRGEAAAGMICPAGGAWKGDGLGPSYVSGRDGRRASLAVGPVVGACAACAACFPGSAVRDIAFIRHGGAGSGAVWQRLAIRRGVK